ncbi:hypothetical protein [Sodalis sp. RH20]|uniref:hypothetical protein n=1 Tax=unclassified Sodalis (in: enterobacteria) TaxID=2636512 RepID=UPI0039B4790E
MSSGQEVLEFAAHYSELSASSGILKPLYAIPTAYPHLTEDELGLAGITDVIDDNHQIRAAHAAMTKVCNIILRTGRFLEAGQHIFRVEDIFQMLATGCLNNR